MTGNAAKISALSMAVQSLLYCPKSVFVESSNVYFLLSDMMMSGNKKSFHIHKIFVIAMVTVDRKSVV